MSPGLTGNSLLQLTNAPRHRLSKITRLYLVQRSKLKAKYKPFEARGQGDPFDQISAAGEDVQATRGRINRSAAVFAQSAASAANLMASEPTMAQLLHSQQRT